ncbi:MAG: hypothetical protein R3185_03270, partial [Candidatus Thermoplasmatota archaeon]|nr:hypothetical protein [Candidatus Thermoplasmatota archaeon]
PVPERSLPLWVLKAVSTAVQTPYHLLGKVPPLSREIIDALEVPLTYSSQRAVDELGWQPSLVDRLAEDFQALGLARDGSV